VARLAAIHRSECGAGVVDGPIGGWGSVGGRWVVVGGGGRLVGVGGASFEVLAASRLVVLGQADAEGSASLVVVILVARQMSAGTARRRWRAARKLVCHGHRAGIRSVTVRAVRVIRPGTVQQPPSEGARSGDDCVQPIQHLALAAPAVQHLRGPSVPMQHRP
jgi:hypothetical protein